MRPGVKGAFLLVLSFGLGCLTGAAALKLTLDRPASWRGSNRTEHFEKTVLGRLTRELALQPEQERKVEAVLRETGQEFRRLREEIGPRFNELRKQGEERIRAVLDPEQRAKFADLVKRWDRRIERWRGRHSGSERAEEKRP